MFNDLIEKSGKTACKCKVLAFSSPLIILIQGRLCVCVDVIFYKKHPHFCTEFAD